MKKLLMNLAIWYLNKCSVQPIKIDIDRHLLYNGKLFQITYYSESISWEKDQIRIEADLVF